MPELLLSCRAHTTLPQRGTLRARAAPSLPGAPAGELVKVARRSLSPHPGFCGHRALQKGSRAGGAAVAPPTQTLPACSRLPAPHSSLHSPTGPTPAAPVGNHSWTGGGTDQVTSEGRLRKVRTVPWFPPAPAPGPGGTCSALGFPFLPVDACSPSFREGSGGRWGSQGSRPHAGSGALGAAAPHRVEEGAVRAMCAGCRRCEGQGSGAGEGRRAGRAGGLAHTDV